MTIQQWLSAANEQLKMAHVDTARLDALVLLSDELSRDKSWILGHPEHIIQGSEIENLSTKIAQRAKHLPLAYVRGKVEFYGREFTINKHVLVPRPESEAMIGLLKSLVSNIRDVTVADIGTGSGALAVSAALELPHAQIFATDISKQCLTVARNNAKLLSASVTFLQGDLLKPLEHILRLDVTFVLLCNLPYVPNTFPINLAAAHEPKLAIFGGEDGLDLYRKLCAQLSVFKFKPQAIITESLCDQHVKLVSLMKTIGYNLHASDGLAQCFVNKST